MLNEQINKKMKKKTFCGFLIPKNKVPTKIVYLGKETKILINIVLNFPLTKTLIFDLTIKNNKLISCRINMRKELMRRFYLMKKCKDSKRIGILLVTLVVKNYLKIINFLRCLIENSGKRCYTIFSGKLTERKLGNFPDLNVFTSVSCHLNIVNDSKKHNKIIINPYDVQIALDPSLKWIKNYCIDLSLILKLYININLNKMKINVYKNNIPVIVGKNKIKKHSKNFQIFLQDGSFIEIIKEKKFWGLKNKINENFLHIIKLGYKGNASNYK